MSNSLSQIVLHLLTKNGPQTSKQLLSHIKEYPEMKSHRFLKSKVLDNMKNQELIYKKIYRPDSNNSNDLKSSKIKPMWLWYINESKINKDAHTKLYPEREKDNVQAKQKDENEVEGIFIFI
jgi:hypothetical protein